MEIEAEEFVGVKGFKAHGKRISTWTIESVEELEPLRFPEPENDEDGEEEDENGNDENINEEAPTAEAPVQTRHFEDETGQLSLFPDEE
jgi:topoisomerase-4 subunit A